MGPTVNEPFDWLQEQLGDNFKARHNCAEKKDKLTPGYWSCNWSW